MGVEKTMKIAIHREINRLPIYFQDEIMVNCFVGILKVFNHFSDDGIIQLTKKELWEMSGIQDPKYREDIVKTLIKELTRSRTYEIKEEGTTLSGSVFIISQNGDELKIEIPKLMQPYIFTKFDKQIINKADKKEKLTLKELDYWDSTLRKKSKELVLIEEAEILGVKGKYAKRLYMLLKPFEGTGYFVMGIEQFRSVMEVPEAYSLAILNRNIINKAQAELEKKEIFEFIVESKGKGRRKIEKIEINFKILPTKNIDNKASKNRKKSKDVKVLETMKEAKNRENENISSEIIELREYAKKESKNLPQSKRFEFLARLIPVKTVQDIEEICKEFGVNFEVR